MPTLIFKETEACNSNCIYCDVIARKKPKTISLEKLTKVFIHVNEYLEKNPHETFSIVWHGGEPLIVGAEFYRNVIKIVDQYCPQTKSRIEYDLQSNLTLLTQEMIDVFKQMGITRVGTSYEPYKGIRGFGPNRDSDAYNRAFFRGVKLLEKNGFGWGFIYVVTKQVLDKPIELFHILTNLKGQHGFQIHPVYSYKNEDRNGVGITVMEFAEFLGAMFQQWWEHRERYPHVDPFYSYLNHYSGGGRVACSESGNCAYTHIYIGPDGEYSHCGRSSDWDVFMSGNVDDTSIIDVFNLDYRRELEQRKTHLAETECKGCEYFRLCHGGCPLDGWNKTGNVMSKTQWCQSQKYFLKNYFEPITGLKFDDSKYED